MHKTGSPHRGTRCLGIRARLEGRCGNWAAAGRALEEALAVSRFMSYPYAEMKSLYAYGQFCLQQRESHQAIERFETTLTICARLGERLYAQQIEDAITVIKQAELHTC